MTKLESIIKQKPSSIEYLRNIDNNMQSICDIFLHISDLELNRPLPHNIGFYSYSGFHNGRIIACYSRDSREIILLNHYLEEIGKIMIPGEMKGAQVYVHVTIEDSIIVLVYHVKGSRIYKFVNMGIVHEVTFKSERVKHVEFWDNGLVYLTMNDEFFLSDNFSSPELFKDIKNLYPDKVGMFKVIPPHYSGVAYTDKDFGSKTQNSPIIYGYGDSPTMKIFTRSNHHQISLSQNILNFAFNSDYSKIGILFYDLRYIYSDVTFTNVSSYQTGVPTDPMFYFGFLGKDCLISSYEGYFAILPIDSEIECVSTGSQSSVPLVFSSDEYLVVYTDYSLRRYTILSQDIIKTTSKTLNGPSYRLINSFYERNGTEIIKLKESIGSDGLSQLEVAILQCLNASRVFSFNSEFQMMYLNALVYGKTFLKRMVSDVPVSETIKMLRVVNFLRNELHIFFSINDMEDYKLLSTIALKFCRADQYELAIQIAEYLGIDIAQIVTHWCSRVIKQVPEDEKAFKLISMKQGLGFDPVAIASEAIRFNRIELSGLIAEKEYYKRKMVFFFEETAKYYNSQITSIQISENTKSETMEKRRSLEIQRDGMLFNAFKVAVKSYDSQLLMDVISRIYCIKGYDFLKEYIPKVPRAFYEISNTFHNEKDSAITSVLKETPLSPKTIDIVLRKRIVKCSQYINQEFVESEIARNTSVIKDFAKYNNSKNPLIEMVNHQFVFAQNIINAKEKLINNTSHKISPEQQGKPLYRFLAEIILLGDIPMAQNIAKEAGFSEAKFVNFVIKSIALNGENKWNILEKLADKKEFIKALPTVFIMAKIHASPTDYQYVKSKYYETLQPKDQEKYAKFFDANFNPQELMLNNEFPNNLSK